MPNPEPVEPTRSNIVVADGNEVAVLKLIHDFGHARRTEVARGVWLDSSERVAKKMAQRTVARLLDKRELFQRPNALRGLSLVLAKRGAGRLRLLGLDAKVGYDLPSVTGLQFVHRTLGTCYLIERRRQGHSSFGEYAIARGLGPVGRGELVERFAKLPDGLVLAPGIERGLNISASTADWIEVESSYKPAEQIERILAIAWKVGTWLDAAERIMLDRVVFVYDSSERHEHIIKRTLKRYLDARPGTNPALLSSIVLVPCKIDLPLIWRGHQELDCADLLGTTDAVQKYPAP